MKSEKEKMISGEPDQASGEERILTGSENRAEYQKKAGR